MEAQEFSLKRELQRKAVHATSVLIVIFCYFLPINSRVHGERGGCRFRGLGFRATNTRQLTLTPYFLCELSVLCGKF